MPKNKRGFSILEVVCGIALFGLIVVTVSELRTFMLESESVSNQRTEFYLQVTSELSRLYAEGWDFEGEKTINSDLGEINVSLEQEGITEHGTEKAKVTFEYKGLEEIYEIERSAYNEQ